MAIQVARGIHETQNINNFSHIQNIDLANGIHENRRLETYSVIQIICFSNSIHETIEFSGSAPGEVSGSVLGNLVDQPRG